MLDAGNGELGEIQRELQAVKSALRDNTQYLGLSGETLQRYLLQLNEKENLLLSRHLHLSTPNGAGVAAGAIAAPAPAMGGAGIGAGGAVIGGNGAQAPLQAAAPPPGSPQAFNRDNAAAVVAHMCSYEAVAVEAKKALRALSSLAYKDASGIGGDEQILRQLLRLLALHPEDSGVRLWAMKAISNMAFDKAVALRKLCDVAVFGALLAVCVQSPDAKDKASQDAYLGAGEAIARIVDAERSHVESGSKEPVAGAGPLATLFVAASFSEACWKDKEFVPKLIKQLVANEVVPTGLIAERFVVAGSAVGAPEGAVGWLSISKTLAATVWEEECQPLPAEVVKYGGINSAARLMERMTGEASVQLVGLEALSALVGTRIEGLQAFAENGGIRIIEAAMATHTGEEVLQTKGIRALASGVLWTEDIQRKASYEASRALALTKAGMDRHKSCEELQQAALEALDKYINKAGRKSEVAADGGDALVKSAMSLHANAPQIQKLGNHVLGLLGAA